MKSLAVPVDSWLRSQLTTIEKAVMMNVRIPDDVPKTKDGAYVYRPLYIKDTLFLTVSKWCKFYKYDHSQGGYVLLDSFQPFEKGHYNVNIEVAHVYIGPHKGGQNFSLSLRITQIMYKEEDKSDNFRVNDELLNQILTPSPSSFPESNPILTSSPLVPQATDQNTTDEADVKKKKKKGEKRVKKLKTDAPSKAVKTDVPSKVVKTDISLTDIPVQAVKAE